MNDNDIQKPETQLDILTIVNDPEPKVGNGRQLAVFDFDGTLVRTDSLKMMMIKMAGGKLPAYGWLLLSFITPVFEAMRSQDRYMDYKTAIKSHWIYHVLRGKKVEQVQDTARAFREELGWYDHVVANMKEYAAEGADIVVATGALDVYIDILLQGLPVKAVICTSVEVENGRLTGRLKGRKSTANAVRDEKRVRVKAYIEQNGPYEHVIGYGNMPDDGPMLSLCDTSYII